MKLSIVIPALNEEKALPELLKCLERQTLDKKDFEVIVADANSTDKTAEIAKSFGAKVVEGGTAAVGRNNGAKIAKADILVFLDADVQFDDDFLERALEKFQKHKLDVAAAFLKVKLTFLISYFFNNMGDNFARFIRQFGRNPVACGDFIMCKKEVLEKVQGFDEKMVFGEDNDFLQRAVRKKSKYRVMKISYSNSPRRIKKVGILMMILSFILFSLAAMLRIQKNKRVQKLIERTYGKVGQVK